MPRLPRVDPSLSTGEMVEEDLDEVLRIERESFANPWSRDHFRAGIVDRRVTWNPVLRRDGKVVAYAVARAAAGEAELLNVAVSSAERRAGLGGALVSMVLDRARALGARVVHLEVRPANRAAIEVYRSLGFRPSGRRRGYYADTGEDALLMSVRLDGERSEGGRKEDGG